MQVIRGIAGRLSSRERVNFIQFSYLKYGLNPKQKRKMLKKNRILNKMETSRENTFLNLKTKGTCATSFGKLQQ